MQPKFSHEKIFMQTQNNYCILKAERDREREKRQREKIYYEKLAHVIMQSSICKLF